MWGKKIPRRLFLPFFFSFRKERRLNSVSLFCVAGALRGSLHCCAFSKGPETRQGRLRGSWRDQSREWSGSWLPAQQSPPAAAPATNGKTSSGAQCCRRGVGIRDGAGLAADSAHPPRELGTLLLRDGGTWGEGASHRSRHPQLLEDGLMLPTYSVMAVLPPAVDYFGFPK